MISICEIYIIAIYLRLSKDDDLEDESLSITNQRRILRDFIKTTFGVDVEIYEYIDDGFSGMNNLRPELNRLMEDIHKKKINCVIVKDCSRLARKNSLISYYVDEFFYEENVRFISLLENFDNTIDADTDKLLLPSIFNEFHVKSTSKKVRKTFENNAKNGLFSGGRAPYGYIKDPNDKHKLLIDDYAADIVRLMFREFLEGKGLKAIAYGLTERGIKIPSEYRPMNRGLKSAHYGTWTTKTISDMLHNPTYAGHLTQHKSKAKNISSKKKVKLKPSEWIIKHNSCPAIVDQETFDKVQDIWETNKRKEKYSQEHLLKGFCWCKECGHQISIVRGAWKRKSGEIKEIYFCRCSYNKNMYQYHVCSPHNIRYNILEEKVLDEIKQMCKKYVKTEELEETLKNNDSLATLKKEIKVNIDKKKMEINVINNKIDNLYDDKLSGTIDKVMYLKFKEKLDTQLVMINDDINNLEKKLTQIEDRVLKNDSKYTSIVKDFLSLKNIDRELLSQIVDKIEIDEEKNLYIHYKIRPLID